MDVLLFTVAARRCAIPLVRIAEVVPAVHIHEVPDAPAIIEGVVNVRGDILPVLSLRARFGLQPKPIDAADYLIIVHADHRRVLVRSDSPPEITSLPPVDVTGAAVDDLGRALSGVVALPDGVALLQDVMAFMNAIDADVLDRAVADAPVRA